MSPMTSSRHAVHVHVPCTNFTAQVPNSTPKLCLPIMLCTSRAKINDAFSNFSQPSCSKIKLLQTNPGYNRLMFQGNHFLLFPTSPPHFFFFSSKGLPKKMRIKDHHHDTFFAFHSQSSFNKTWCPLALAQKAQLFRLTIQTMSCGRRDQFRQ